MVKIIFGIYKLTKSLEFQFHESLWFRIEKNSSRFMWLVFNVAIDVKTSHTSWNMRWHQHDERTLSRSNIMHTQEVEEVKEWSEYMLSCYNDRLSRRLKFSNNHKMQQSWEFSNSSRNCTQELMRNIFSKKINFIRYHFHFISSIQQKHQHQIWWCSLEIVSVISFSTLVDVVISSYIYYIGEN